MKYYCAILLDCKDESPFVYFDHYNGNQSQINIDKSVVENTVNRLSKVNPESSYKIIEIEL